MVNYFLFSLEKIDIFHVLCMYAQLYQFVPLAKALFKVEVLDSCLIYLDRVHHCSLSNTNGSIDVYKFYVFSL